MRGVSCRESHRLCPTTERLDTGVCVALRPRHLYERCEGDVVSPYFQFTPDNCPLVSSNGSALDAITLG